MMGLFKVLYITAGMSKLARAVPEMWDGRAVSFEVVKPGERYRLVW